MTTLDTGILTRMAEWRRRKAQSEQSAADRARDAARRKDEAWDLWKTRANCENLTLREIVDGPVKPAWPAEREARERRLFEEFWAEQAA